MVNWFLIKIPTPFNGERTVFHQKVLRWLDACVLAQLLSHVWLFWDPMDCSPPGSSVQGIHQARILEWVAISSSRGSSWPRDRTFISCLGRQILYHWATWEAPRQLDSHMQKDEHGTPYLLVHTKFNSKWFKDLNIRRARPVQILEENIDKFSWPQIRHISLRYDTKSTSKQK